MAHHDHLLPELWVRESIYTLLNNPRIAKLHKQFEDVVHDAGDFTKVKGETVHGSLIEEPVQVKLDKTYWQSFEIEDRGIHCLSLPDLLRVFMQPAMENMARLILDDLAIWETNRPEGHTTILAVRPLPRYHFAPGLDPGSRQFVGAYQGISMRCIMQYDSLRGRVRVKFEMLAGFTYANIVDPTTVVEVKRRRAALYEAIEAERSYQDKKWGTEFDDKNTANDWAKYINDYASKATPLKLDVAEFEKHMLKVAALAIAAVETSRRNGGPAKRHYDA